ncbi:MAG TPA: uridine kinase [Polyangiaceae bacterium]|jgi:uridine kinase
MRPLILGIAGGTGSGKTTVAEKIANALPEGRAVVIQHDWYYLDRSHLSPEERALINFDEPAALDNGRLLEDLAALRAGRATACPQYDFATHTRHREARLVPAHPIVVVEGILLFAIPAVRDAFDLRLFVDTDDDIRLLRRIRRDIEERGRDIGSIEAQYRKSVRPMHELHVAPSRRHAHLIIPEGGENEPALDVIVGKLLYMLAT